MNHVMIDLETMATTPDAAIVSIGAVLFNPTISKVSKSKTFYYELDYCMQGRELDENTRVWWSKQSQFAKKALNGTCKLREALLDLSAFIPKNSCIWGHGSLFDVGILENACRQYDLKIPWSHYNVRDTRTIIALYKDKFAGSNPRLKNNHNALDDAINQANLICDLWGKLATN